MVKTNVELKKALEQSLAQFEYLLSGTNGLTVQQAVNLVNGLSVVKNAATAVTSALEIPREAPTTSA